MKRILLETTSLKSCTVLTALLTLSAFTSDKSGKSGADHIDSIVINKAFERRNYNIEISTNAEHNRLVISASKHHKKTYRFFLFDIDGRLKAQTDIRGNESTALVNISKGDYYYEIFGDNERIENGQVMIK